MLGQLTGRMTTERGRNVTRTFRDAEAATPEQLAEMTPSQVDELLVAARGEGGVAAHRIGVAKDLIHIQAQGKRLTRERVVMSFAEALSTVSAQSRDGEKSAVKVLADMDRAMTLQQRVHKVMNVIDAEYHRRGKWTRAWLVTDGHAHRTSECSTCHREGKRTSMELRAVYSGMDEAAIVAAAGDRACTVCYPSAPVKAPASVMFTEEEAEREERRALERARREEKKAKSALNAITQPDGTPLRDEMGRDGQQRGSVIGALRTARSGLKQQCWFQYAWGDKDGCRERNIQHLARAVAWKENGLPVGTEPSREQIDAVIEPLRVKAVKEVDKARRENSKRN